MFYEKDQTFRGPGLFRSNQVLVSQASSCTERHIHAGRFSKQDIIPKPKPGEAQNTIF